MQKKNFEILVQTALTMGLFWTILKLTPKSTLLSFTILYLEYYQVTLIYTVFASAVFFLCVPTLRNACIVLYRFIFSGY